MHIQEGFLTAKWAITWYGVAIIFIGKGLRDVVKRTKEVVMFKPLVGLMGAAVFFMSLMPIPVPITGSCSHPAGTPLAAILLGPFVGTVLSVVALILQATFFAHGGFSTMGANVVSMGVVGPIVSYALFKLARRMNLSLAWSAGIAGVLGDLSVYLMSSTELALGMPNMPFGSFSHGVIIFMKLYMPTQLPIALLEGLITAGMVSYVAKVRPDILRNLNLLPVRQEEEVEYGQHI